jgi:DNA-binding beta-propeller fold protein YncE
MINWLLKHYSFQLWAILAFFCFLPATLYGAVIKLGAVHPDIIRLTVFRGQGGDKLLHTPLAIARDAKTGDLIASSFRTNEVVILDKQGFLIKKLGRSAGLVSPYGVAVDELGRIYVSEIQTGMVKILSPGGRLEDEIDLSKAMGRVVAPGRITLDRDGTLYVADLKDNVILVFNGRGDFVHSIAGFDYLQKAGLVNGHIIGLSAYGKTVQIFTKTGKMLSTFGGHGVISEQNFSFPSGFAVDSKGRLWITDAFQHRLRIFSLAGEHLFDFGKMQEKDGGFFFPVDLCFGRMGKLYVLEKGGERIQVFQVSDLKE